MAQALLITTLLTIAGLAVTIYSGLTASSEAEVGNHILLALATVVMGLFSQSMTMFFFIGTGKEIKEQAKGIAGEATVIQETKSFKSRVFPIAFYSMMVIMVTFILGGGIHTGKLPKWSHQLLAIASLGFYLRAYWVELQVMNENATLMERFLRDSEE